MSRYVGLSLAVIGILSFLNGGGVITGAVIGAPVVNGGMWYGVGAVLFLAGLLVLLFGD